MNAIDQLQEVVDRAQYLVFFGGAGISTESGIPDFRSADGIYRMQEPYSYPPEEIISHHFFLEHPEEFYHFYREKMLYLDAQPNAAHRKLAQLEQEGPLKAVITQNIDGLHQAAGSQEVLELHGSVHRNFCQKCRRLYGAEVVAASRGVPRCSCGGVIKPDVVLYEESLDQEVMLRAVEHLRQADTLIVGGTSLTVYPAAGLLDYFRGDQLVVINRTQVPHVRRAALMIQDSIAGVLDQVKVPGRA